MGGRGRRRCSEVRALLSALIFRARGHSSRSPSSCSCCCKRPLLFKLWPYRACSELIVTSGTTRRAERSDSHAPSPVIQEQVGCFTTISLALPLLTAHMRKEQVTCRTIPR